MHGAARLDRSNPTSTFAATVGDRFATKGRILKPRECNDMQQILHQARQAPAALQSSRREAAEATPLESGDVGLIIKDPEFSSKPWFLTMCRTATVAKVLRSFLLRRNRTLKEACQVGILYEGFDISEDLNQQLGRLAPRNSTQITLHSFFRPSSGIVHNPRECDRCTQIASSASQLRGDQIPLSNPSTDTQKATSVLKHSESRLRDLQVEMSTSDVVIGRQAGESFSLSRTGSPKKLTSEPPHQSALSPAGGRFSTGDNTHSLAEALFQHQPGVAAIRPRLLPATRITTTAAHRRPDDVSPPSKASASVVGNPSGVLSFVGSPNQTSDNLDILSSISDYRPSTSFLSSALANLAIILERVASLDDVVGQLEKLNDMKANGVLTETEFATAKKHILSRTSPNQ